MEKFKKMLLPAAVLLGLVSCSKTDLYNEQAAVQDLKTEYAQNFVKKYGPISSNQTWDFTKGERLGTRAAGEIKTEIVPGLDFGIEETVVDNKLVSTITKNLPIYNNVTLKLPDGIRHKGESAILVAPSSSFYIYPISVQGSYTHDLYVQIGDEEPVLVYQKDWKLHDKPYINGMATASTVKDGEANITKRAVMNGIKIQAPIGTPVQIIADNVKSGTTPQPSASTVTGSAIVVDAGDAKPEGVELQEDAVIQYVGIEDNFNGDFDYNDVVLVMVGNPDAPETVKIDQEEYTVNTNISKRYMVEDLGDTDDFDFNDIVIDVVQNTTIKHRTNAVEGKLISDVVVSTTVSQKATIHHLGGTLPFTLKIGNTTLPEMGGQDTFQTDPEKTVNVSGWNPTTNNITVTVRDLKSNKVYDIQFPKAGEAPMIIAVDPEQAWMSERKSVPASWFYIPE